MPRTKGATHREPDFDVEWTAAVNVVRWYMGCQEYLPLPKEPHPDPLWQGIAEQNIRRWKRGLTPLPLPDGSKDTGFRFHKV